jgi:quaternary ammonium compound-resistance protein SugE
MSWIYLLLAGILEAVWAVGLKYTDGFSRLGPSMVVGLAIIGSMFLLALALKTIPVGTGYAIWVSIGILGAAISGPVLFNQSLRPIQIFFLAMLLVAIVGLKLTAKES